MLKAFRHGGLAAACIVLACASGCASLSPPPGAERWVASWGTAQLPLKQADDLPAELWKDGTVRQVVRLSLGGSKLRVRISNVYGTQVMEVGAASIGRARRSGSSEVIENSMQPLLFGGSAAVRIPAGTEYVSDPVEMATTRGADMAITLHLSGAPGQQTGHPGARATSFLAPGRQTAAPVLNEAKAITRWHQLADLEVSAPTGSRALVVIGDSITDGYGVAPDTNGRWTDYLVARLAQHDGPPLAVINAGIGGGRLLREGLGPSLASRFERDVLARNGVSHAIVFIGVNDIGVQRRDKQDSPQAIDTLLADLQQAHLQLVGRAHAKGICVIGATVTPFMGSGYYQPSSDTEKLRQTLNDWIRTSNTFDGVLDFDAALRDPQRPAYLAKGFDSGDGLHPSRAGYQALAAVVPLASLDRCARSPR